MTTDSLLYLDNAASTPTDPRVVAAMLPCFTANYGNPSANHPLGRQGREAVEAAREQVARLLGCAADEIIFTSGGTEADNLALFGVTAASAGKGRHIVTSAVEHHAVLEACRHLEGQGYRVTYLPVNSCGQVSVAELEAALTPETLLVSIMAANNVLGTLEPLSDIGPLCRERGVFFHADAVQMAGHLPMDVAGDRIDLLSLSAHKFGGPKGAGALYARREVPLAPVIFGGGQEEGLRSGTENVPGIVGLGKAAEIARDEMVTESSHIAALSNQLIAGILGAVPGAFVNGHPERRLPGIVNICIPGVEAEYLCRELAKNGICAGTGAACSSASHEAPYVLLATGLERDLANCCIRLSLGRQSTGSDIENAVATLGRLVGRIREESAG